jgi:hypothetical protein
VKRHDNGWLEIYTSNDIHGFVPPAWVEELPADGQNTCCSLPCLRSPSQLGLILSHILESPPPVDVILPPPPPPEDPVLREASPDPIATPSDTSEPPPEPEPMPTADPVAKSPAPLQTQRSLTDIASTRAAPAPVPASRAPSSESVLSPPQVTARPKPRLSVNERPAPQPRSPKPARKPAPKPQPRPPVRQAETTLTYATPSNNQDGDASPPSEEATDPTPAATPAATQAAMPPPPAAVDAGAPVEAEEDAPPTRPAPVPTGNGRPTSMPSPSQSSGETTKLRAKSSSVMSAFASQLEATLGHTGPAKVGLRCVLSALVLL